MISQKKYNAMIEAYEKKLEKTNRENVTLRSEIQRLNTRLSNREAKLDNHQIELQARLKKERQVFETRLQAATCLPGIRSLGSEGFYQLLSDYEPHFSRGMSDRGSFYELEYALQEEATRFLIQLPKRASFASLEQALSIFKPQELPIISVLGLDRFQAKCLPCRFAEYHDETPENSPGSLALLGAGKKWKYEITLTDPSKLDFLVFVPKFKPQWQAKPSRSLRYMRHLMRLVRERELNLVFTCADFGENCTRVLDGGDQWLFCLKGQDAYLDSLRRRLEMGELRSRKVDFNQRVMNLQGACLEAWQKRFPEVYLK